MATPAQLLYLPTEILTGILEEVPSQASLASLVRTCRRLQTLVEPYLYRSVYLGNHAGESFTYAMDRKTVRVEYIQELVIHYHYLEDVLNEKKYYPILVESLVQGSMLCLKSGPGSSSNQPSRCELIMNDLTPTPLQNLTGELWYFSSRETVLLHPKLRKLSIVAAIIPGLRSETLNYTKRPWFIPTSLETLSLEVDFYLHTDCPALDFRDFKCLQHLTIDSKVLRGDNDGQSPEAEKHLRQNCHLPPSLRSLRFREYRERGRPDLLTLSIVLDWVMSGGLRNLENITAQSATFFSHAILGASVPDGKSFQQAFRAVGVELAVERVRSSLGDEHLTIDCKCCSFYWRYLDQWDN